ncbi:hypothetical protein [Pantoea agglomerans]|uniref:hypothetical protein n=1 Tax=Enterobacter agglomerans TaxID=549 RepID=UPI0016543B04|nr:hypothetical protein [Pantoea agglomerans]
MKNGLKTDLVDLLMLLTGIFITKTLSSEVGCQPSIYNILYDFMPTNFVHGENPHTRSRHIRFLNSYT